MNRLEVMHAFVRVVDARSFSKAAKLLNIGQPAVSKAIAQLERRLDVSLLTRSTHGLTPTEAGRHFFEHACRAIEEADRADLAARGAAVGFTGSLRIGASVTFGSLHVVPRLPGFLATHPNLSIDLVLDDRSVDLIKEGIDVGLRIGPLRNSRQIAQRIATSRCLVVGTPSYFEKAGIPETPEGLISHAAVTCVSDCSESNAWVFRQGAIQLSVNPSGRLRVSAADGMRAAVLAGMGLAIASEWLFTSELQRGAVQAVLTDWALPNHDLWVLFPAGRKTSAKARAFAAFLKAELLEQQHGPELSAVPTPLLLRSFEEIGASMPRFG